MKTVILVLIFTLTLYAAALAQSNFTDNTFVITTYYPAPYGVYTNLRLHPSDDPTGKEGVIEGVMYYDRTLHMMRYLNNATWVNVTAGQVGPQGQQGPPGTSSTGTGNMLYVISAAGCTNMGTVTLGSTCNTPCQAGTCGVYGCHCATCDGTFSPSAVTCSNTAIGRLATP